MRPMEMSARNKLLESSMDNVNRIVHAMVRRMGPKIDKEEIRSFALMGLAIAIDRYDSNMGIPFDAYASPRIKGAIYDGISQNGHLPRRLFRQVAFYRKMDEMMSHESDIAPPADKVETAHRLADRLKDLATAYVTTSASLDEVQVTSGPPPMDSETLVDKKQYYARVNACIGTLPDKQQMLVRMYFYEDKNLREIAELMGHTKSWATKVLQAALRALRNNFDEPPLD